MAEGKALWRHRRVVSGSFWLRRRAAAFVLTFTAAAAGTVFVWLLVGGGLVGLWYAIHVVSSAHNPTLTWTIGVCLVVMFLLCFIPATTGGKAILLRRGTPVVAIVDPVVYAYRVGDRIQAVRRADIKSVRRMFGVVAMAGKTRSEWVIVPADIFPTRAQWRKLKGLNRESPRSPSARADADMPRWGG